MCGLKTVCSLKCAGQESVTASKAYIYKCYGTYIKWQCALIINGYSHGLRRLEHQFLKYLECQKICSHSIVLFVRGHHLVLGFTIMKAAYTAVGGKVTQLV